LYRQYDVHYCMTQEFQHLHLQNTISNLQLPDQTVNTSQSIKYNFQVLATTSLI